MKQWMEFFGIIIAANALFIFVLGIFNILFELDIEVEGIALPYHFGELTMLSLGLLAVGGLFWLVGNLGRLFKQMGKRPVQSVAIAAVATAVLIIFGNFGLTMAMGGPVQRAVEMGNTQQVEKLLNQNAYSPNELNRPLYFALRQSDYDMAEALVSAGADVNYVDIKGEFDTPLLLSAASHFEKEAIAFLLDKGADANVKDNLGRTAMIITVTYRADKFSEEDALIVLEKLHQAGADASIAAKDGKTPADIAASRNKEPIVDYLNQVASN